MPGPGDTIGGYRVLSVLGKGGMGVVYLAEGARGRRVALKVVSPQFASDPDFMARFRREGRALKALSHPNVVGFLGSGAEGGSPYLVFECFSGGDLREEIRRRGRFAWRDAASLGARIARGLGAVHAAGLIHRDLKPENVLLSEEGEPKLSDFGLVGSEAASLAVSQALTRTGELLGTLAYMAPEQADGGRDVTAKADLYSFGVLLYAMLAGVTSAGRRATTRARSPTRAKRSSSTRSFRTRGGLAVPHAPPRAIATERSRT